MFRAEEILTRLVECFSGIFLEVQHLKKWKIEKHQKKNINCIMSQDQFY